MLALGRKVGEQIYIDVPGCQRITLTVLSLDRGHVRLGFEAPREYKITRDDAGPERRGEPPVYRAGEDGR